MSRGRRAPEASALALAEQAHALVQAHPRQALALAENALAASVAARDAEAEVAARHALGWAQYVLGDPRSGRVTLTIGIRLARRSSNRRGEGLLRRHLAFWLALDGETRAAEREIAAAISLLPRLDRARSQVQRMEIHRKSAGNSDPELHRRVCADAARALSLVRREGDEIWEARLLNSRALVYKDRGELDAAEADLVGAREIFERLGAEAAALDMTVVIAEIALLRGEVLAALRVLEEIQPELSNGRTHEYNLENLEECRVRALVEARMLPEARRAAEALLDLCSRTRQRESIPFITLDLAAIAMMSNDPDAAVRFAQRSARLLLARGRLADAAIARATALRARIQEGGLSRASVRSALNAAAALAAAHRRRDELRTRLLAARVALAVGDRKTAVEQLRMARSLQSRGPVTDRIELYHARALLALSDGRPAAAESLLRRGLGLLDAYRAALGAVELRANASGMGVELSRSGLRLALDSRRPAKVLTWAETLRSSALRLSPVRPPSDARVRALQYELRRTVSEARDAEAAGRPARGAAARQARLEAAIRARARIVEPGADVRSRSGSVRDASGALGRRALIEYVESAGVLFALTLAEGRLVLHELGPGDVVGELEWLRFALTRLARAGRSSSTERAAAFSNADASSTALDRLLIEPLLSVVGEAELVLVPTGALHAVPWGALPSLRGRSLTVAPSLATWLDLMGSHRAPRRKTALIAGPGLRYSGPEVRELTQLYPAASVRYGNAATASAVLSAIDGVGLAHFACHGTFRADSPFFSSLELADGPLNVYELERLRRAPEVVVLSACDLAQSDLRPGDELLGLASALLGMGTRTIIASVVPVPDAGARRLMLDLHRRLVAGEDIASALAHAQVGRPESGFVCLGAA